MNILELQDVWKTYQMGSEQVHALRGLSIQVSKGDFLAILGPSGSGKSTAMNILGLLDVPTKGKVLLHGKNVSSYGEDALSDVRGQTIGFIFQKFNLLNTLTALQNVMLPLMFQGVSEEEREKRAADSLERVGLGDRLRHRPTELSGGQQQRVAIARALVNNPDVVLADEPTGNLDSTTGHRVIDHLKKLNKEGKTIVLVTHEISLAEHAKKKVLLEDGRRVR